MVRSNYCFHDHIIFFCQIKVIFGQIHMKPIGCKSIICPNNTDTTLMFCQVRLLNKRLMMYIGVQVSEERQNIPYSDIQLLNN